MRRVGAVILAAGQGKRMNSPVQKQYMMLEEKPLISYSLEVFAASKIDEVVLVVGAGEEDYVRREILFPMGLEERVSVVCGGKERYHSVYAGVSCLKDCDYILIHDGARPFVTKQIIERAVLAAEESGACVVGMPVKDTIKISDGKGYAADTPDRSLLWQIQTPQAFEAKLILEGYKRLMADSLLQEGITDDAMVVERCMGHPVRLVEGSYENLKVTTPEDMVIAGAILQQRCKNSL